MVATSECGASEAWVPALRSSARRCTASGTRELSLEKPARRNPRQMRDRPVVDVGPDIGGGAILQRHAQHLPYILGRLLKPLAARLVHVEFVQQLLRRAQ